MKKLIHGVLYLSISLFLLTSCSNDEDSVTTTTTILSSGSGSSSATGSFKVNNETFNLVPSNAMVGLKMVDTPLKGQTRLSLTISGIQGTTKTAAVSFDLFYVTSQGVSGTYTMYDNDSTEELDAVVTKNGRACSGWTSLVLVTSTTSLTPLVDANDPAGTVTIKDNGNGTYTIIYKDNYREYDDDLETIIRTIPVEVNLTSTVTIN